MNERNAGERPAPSGNYPPVGTLPPASSLKNTPMTRGVSSCPARPPNAVRIGLLAEFQALVVDTEKSLQSTADGGQAEEIRGQDPRQQARLRSSRATPATPLKDNVRERWLRHRGGRLPEVRRRTPRQSTARCHAGFLLAFRCGSAGAGFSERRWTCDFTPSRGASSAPFLRLQGA